MIARKPTLNALAAAVLLATAGHAWAEPQIRAISSSPQPQGETIRVEFSEPLTAAPQGFAVQTPPRVAIDLPGVSNAMASNAIELGQGNVRQVNVASSGERTRLVLALKSSASYRTEVSGNTLLVHVDSAAAAAAPASTTSWVAAQPAQAAQEALAVHGIDFRRGPEGAGRLVVDLASPQVGVDIKQQGQRLIVELARSSLPETLRRRIDVSDFGSPVQSVTASQEGERVRLVVDARGAWEHSAYQTENQFVLDVRPVKMDPNKVLAGGGYSGEKVSLNFQNIEVRALLQVIADISNFNVVTSDAVTGNLTLRMKDVPWDQALDVILQARGLGMRKAGNVLWVAPKEELVAKEQVELEAQKKVAELEPVRTQSFQLNYAKADDLAKALSGQGAVGATSPNGQTSSRILSPRGSVLPEPRTNQLFISDIPSKLEEVALMIAKIDVPVRQVMIEARIVEADDKFGRALGIKLGASDQRGVRGGLPGYGIGGDNRVVIGSNYGAVGAQTLQPGATMGYNDTQFVSLPANTSSLGGAAAATLAFSLFSATANRFLNLELSALEAEGRGKIVSSPRVVTTDQAQALVEQGEELPYQVASSSGATAIQFKKASLKLDVRPQITPEGSVILEVDVSKDSRGSLTPAGPSIDTKHIKTQVLVENGGTVVIGGIYTQDERDEVNKVPLLGDVPYMGNLFKNKVRSSTRTELLVFITPKIVTDREAVR